MTKRRKTGPPDFGAIEPLTFHKILYRKPVVRIPSVIVPRESNSVLLPEARGFAASIDWIEPLDFDNRLFHYLET